LALSSQHSAFSIQADGDSVEAFSSCASHFG